MTTRASFRLKSLQLLSSSLALTLLFASSCSSSNGLVLSKLDPKTSVTITYNDSPLVFFRALATSSTLDKEHVYLGPVEVNRSGEYRYYLWLATWGTMDVAQNDQRQGRYESIDVVADGKPVTLRLMGNSSQAIGASEPVYPKPVAWATEAYYDVTLDQLRQIAEATNLQVEYSSTREIFEPWNNQISTKAGLIEFLVHSEY